MITDDKRMICPFCWVREEAQALISFEDRIRVEIQFACGVCSVRRVDPVLYAGLDEEQICRAVNRSILQQQGVIIWS